MTRPCPCYSWGHPPASQYFNYCCLLGIRNLCCDSGLQIKVSCVVTVATQSFSCASQHLGTWLEGLKEAAAAVSALAFLSLISSLSSSFKTGQERFVWTCLQHPYYHLSERRGETDRVINESNCSYQLWIYAKCIQTQNLPFLLFSHSQQPVVKLLYNRSNNKYSYTRYVPLFSPTLVGKFLFDCGNGRWWWMT